MTDVETGAAADEGDDDGPHGAQTRFERAMSKLGQIIAIVVVLALLVGAVAGAFEIWPDQVSAGDDPSWLDSIFASKTVLFAARVVLFSAAVVLFVGAAFIVASIVVRWREKQLLHRIGPFEISDVRGAVASLEQQIEELQLVATAGEEEINSLRESLAETEDLAQHFYGLWEKAIEQDDHENQ